MCVCVCVCVCMCVKVKPTNLLYLCWFYPGKAAKEACDTVQDCADNMQCTDGVCQCQDHSLLQIDGSCGEYTVSRPLASIN